MSRDLFVEQTADGLLPPVPHVGHLEKLGQAGHQDAGTDEQHQTQCHPYEGVDLVVNGGQTVQECA